MNTIYDGFLKKLINLKSYTIISEKTSYLILLTKIKLPIEIKMQKSIFQTYTEVKKMGVHFVFMLDLAKLGYLIVQEEVEEREKLIAANIPRLTIETSDIEMGVEELEKKLQDFIVQMLNQNMRFSNNISYQDLV